MSFHVVHTGIGSTFDPEAIPVVAIYGDELRQSFDRESGPCFALVRVPADAILSYCDGARPTSFSSGGGSLELFSGPIDHAGAEAVYSFAIDETDPDFAVVARTEELIKIRFVHPIRGTRLAPRGR